MNEPKPVDRNADRLAVMFRNVRENSRIQRSPENRENYFRSCEAHGDDLAEVVKVVRAEQQSTLKTP